MLIRFLYFFYIVVFFNKAFSDEKYDLKSALESLCEKNKNTYTEEEIGNLSVISFQVDGNDEIIIKFSTINRKEMFFIMTFSPLQTINETVSIPSSGKSFTPFGCKENGFRRFSNYKEMREDSRYRYVEHILDGKNKTMNFPCDFSSFSLTIKSKYLNFHRTNMAFLGEFYEVPEISYDNEHPQSLLYSLWSRTSDGRGEIINQSIIRIVSKIPDGSENSLLLEELCHQMSHKTKESEKSDKKSDL